MKRASSVSILLGCALAAASWAPGAASAQTPAVAASGDRELRGLSLSLVVANGRWFGDGYRLFDRGDGDAAGGVEASYDVMAIGAGGRLAVGLGLQGEALRSEGGPVAGSLAATTFYATAIARFRTQATWQPYVALAAGLDRGELELVPGGQQMSSEAYGLMGRASLGLRCAPARLTIRNQRGTPVFALSLGLEVAGSLGSGLSFEYRAEPPSQGAGDSDRIRTESVSLGRVSRQGLHGRGLATVTF